jgi:hypothetical protein
MRRVTAIGTFGLAAALTLPAAPAGAKGLVGMSVCGAHGCVDRSAIVPTGGGRAADALLDAGIVVADPGRARFVRLKLHLGDPATKQSFGTDTIIYLTTSGLIRIGDGTWRRPEPPAATLYKRAAHGVAPFPPSALRPFRPPTGQVVETVPPPRPQPARGAATDGGGDFPAGLVGGAVAALLLAGGAAFVLVRRGRPATG